MMQRQSATRIWYAYEYKDRQVGRQVKVQTLNATQRGSSHVSWILVLVLLLKTFPRVVSRILVGASMSIQTSDFTPGKKIDNNSVGCRVEISAGQIFEFFHHHVVVGQSKDLMKIDQNRDLNFSKIFFEYLLWGLRSSN